ncbi:MAG TPA: ABC transporter permease [Terriglobia bacterium]|nr:ABC transporter permease [Terriglobia bacterium]
MNWFREVVRRLWTLIHRNQFDSDLQEEMRLHRELREKQEAERGLSPEEAHYAVQRRFGNDLVLREESRDMWGWNWLESLFQDLRYGLRALIKNPGFTAVAVVTLALGVGANTAIFSVVCAVLVRPLPYKDPGQLVLAWQIEPQLDRAPVTTHDFFAWEEGNDVFASMAAGTEGLSRASLTGGGEAEAVRSAPVSAGLLEMLGVQPALGRLMRVEEDVPGHDALAILSYGLWERRFGSDPRVIGQTLTLDGKVREIIGVMPKEFVFPRIWGIKPDLYIPLAPRRGDAPTGNWLYVIARLKPGVSFRQAQTAIKALAARQAKLHPETNRDLGAQIELLRDYLVGDFPTRLLVLFGVVGFVLLIACANVANLQLARTTARERELAVRTALGAGRLRLLRQLLTENMLLSVLGGAAGLLVAIWAKVFLLSLSPPDYFPRASEINISPGVLAFTLGLTILTGVLFGLFPALRGFRSDLNESLKEGTRSLTDSVRSRRTRSAVVVTQLSLAFILLVGAGLMIRSLQKLADVNLGFETANIVTMEVDLPEFRYTKPEQALTFYQGALTRIQGLPGVRAAAFTSQLPLGGGPNGTIQVEGAPQTPGFGEGPLVQPTEVTQDYFRVLGILLLKGRTFTLADAPHSTPVCVVNAALANHFWPGRDPVGKRLRFSGDSTWLEVVGVVGNSRRWSLFEEAMPEVYFPYVLSPDIHMKLVVRTATDPQGLVRALRAQISAVDSNVPVYAVATMQQAVSESTAGHRFLTLLMTVFALVALILVVSGVYGVISCSVARETHDIGVRMALGAKREDILKLVLGKVTAIAILGVGIGLAGAVGLTRFLSGMLFEVKPTDPLTFVGVAMSLLTVALVTCYIPARRATMVDPMVALRYE